MIDEIRDDNLGCRDVPPNETQLISTIRNVEVRVDCFPGNGSGVGAGEDGAVGGVGGEAWKEDRCPGVGGLGSGRDLGGV